MILTTPCQNEVHDQCGARAGAGAPCECDCHHPEGSVANVQTARPLDTADRHDHP